MTFKQLSIGATIQPEHLRPTDEVIKSGKGIYPWELKKNELAKVWEHLVGRQYMPGTCPSIIIEETPDPS